jgi:hypothetical protein
MDHLKSLGHELYRPTPIPIEEDSAGPFSERRHMGEPL